MVWDLGLLKNSRSSSRHLWYCQPLEEDLSNVCLLPAWPVEGLEIAGLLVKEEQSLHCQIFFFFFAIHPNAGLLCSTVGDTVLRSLCSWQRFLCSLSAASCVGKFHPLTLGLYVTIAEIIDRVHLICCKHGR